MDEITWIFFIITHTHTQTHMRICSVVAKSRYVPFVCVNALALQIDDKYFKHEITYLRFRLKMQQQGNLRRIDNVWCCCLERH